jgi:hypothetical protein
MAKPKIYMKLPPHQHHHHHQHHQIRTKPTKLGLMTTTASKHYSGGSIRCKLIKKQQHHQRGGRVKNTTSGMNSIKLKTKTCPNLVNISYTPNHPNHNVHTSNSNNPKGNFKLLSNSIENFNSNNNIDKDLIDLSSSSACDIMSKSLRSLSSSSSSSSLSNSTSASSSSSLRRPPAIARPEQLSSACSLLSIESNTHNKEGLLSAAKNHRPLPQLKLANKNDGGARKERNYFRLKKDMVEKGDDKIIL